MINFKFVKSQFKNIIVPMVVFFVILIILIIPALTQGYFAPAKSFYSFPGSGSSSRGSSSIIGGAVILETVFFGIPGFILLFSFGIILIHILVSKEIERGYFASWLTMPMSRRTILNSKFFVLISSILIVYFSTFLVQLILFPIVFKDFNAKALADIVLYNFALIFLVLLWTSINWFIICLFDKAAKSISIAAAISIFFVICAVLNMLSRMETLYYLKFFKYLTITSLINSPFSFGSLPDLGGSFPPDDFNGVISAEILDIKALDFAWQLPVMFVLPFAFFPLGNLFIIKRDLSL